MNINKQGNLYTICYIIVLVVIVGIGLAFASNGLKSRQIDNANAEKMRQILSSVRISSDSKDVKILFADIVKKQLVVNEEGDSIGDYAFDIVIAKEAAKKPEDRQLPLYFASVDNTTKYIIPVAGSGLWGPIWGYVSLESDGTTIYGAYFTHEGETPGLGAEIEKPFFTEQFRGKRVFIDDNFRPVNVLKLGTKPQSGEDYVDAVSGGTITSRGVAAMLENCLLPYESYLRKISTLKD